jgi:putative transposase
MNSRRFTPEFKRECAELVLDHGYSFRQACEASDVGVTAMRRWVRQLEIERGGLVLSGQGIPSPAPPLTPEQQYIRQLEERVQRLERDKEILKGYSFADVGRQQALKLVAALSQEYSVKELCAVLGVCRSLVYYHRKRQKQPDTTRIALQRRVAELHRLGRGSAGARTLSLLLRREGENVGRYKAGRLMKEAGLVSRQPGKHRYRLCNRQSNLAENHLSRNFTVNAPDNVWCGDITFIRTQAGWLYLAVVLDLYARKVVGWAFSSVADSQLAQNALTMAWETGAVQKD